eukprot:gnl/Spiro4/10025_TR5315_c0_g1_i1.p1 gnl/Spiro4/10025_TR5315_c0_g1~~gnl/Spiro4/10025_TR5315_c0_g1_i1.p1  ORF type:complete len:884 (-),score=253.77 gnl/Spiro4/10025_TR5315_c0_g1_i1:58-2709(-)
MLVVESVKESAHWLAALALSFFLGLLGFRFGFVFVVACGIAVYKFVLFPSPKKPDVSFIRYSELVSQTKRPAVETIDWLARILNVSWRPAVFEVEKMLKATIDSVAEASKPNLIDSIKCKQFDLGTAAPLMKNVTAVFDSGSGHLHIDFDTFFLSDGAIRIKVSSKLPLPTVVISKLTFTVKTRVVLDTHPRNLADTGLRLSFLNDPHIDFDVGKVPDFVISFIKKLICSDLAGRLVWPLSISIPLQGYTKLAKNLASSSHRLLHDDGSAITDIQVVYADGSLVIPRGYVLLDRTCSNSFCANLNQGSDGVKVYILYRTTKFSDLPPSVENEKSLAEAAFTDFAIRPVPTQLPPTYFDIGQNLKAGTSDAPLFLCGSKQTDRSRLLTGLCLVKKSHGEKPPPGYELLLNTLRGPMSEPRANISSGSDEMYFAVRYSDVPVPPITDISIMFSGYGRDEHLPPGWSVLARSHTGHSANIAKSTKRSCHIVYRRTLAAPPVSGLCLLWARTDSLPDGYDMVQLSVGNEPADLNAGGGEMIFLALSRDPAQPPITRLALQAVGGEVMGAGYTRLNKTVSGKPGNLNHNNSTGDVYLYYLRPSLHSAASEMMLVNPLSGDTVSAPTTYAATYAPTMYATGSSAPPPSFLAERMPSVSVLPINIQPETPVGSVTSSVGSLLADGGLLGRSGSLTARSTDSSESLMRLECLVDIVVLFTDAPSHDTAPYGYTTITSSASHRHSADLNSGSGGRNIYLAYKKMSVAYGSEPAPITDIAVVFRTRSESPPPNFTLIEKTVGGETADLNSGSGGEDVFLAVRRGYDKNPISDLAVMVRDDACPSGWIKIVQTVGRKPADLNAGSGSVFNQANKVYLAYQRNTAWRRLSGSSNQ